MKKRLLMGIVIIAEQLSRASAENICHALDKVQKKFDLIGLVSTFGTGAATKSLAYSVLNDWPCYLAGHIGPGSLSVAVTLFQATEFRLAKLLVALGGMGNANQIAQLDCPDGLKYIGLKSNSDCPVVNKVGANIVREHLSLWKKEKRSAALQQDGSRGESVGEPQVGQARGRNANRKVNVYVLKMESEGKKDVQVVLKAGKVGPFFLGWLPLLLTVGVIAISCSLCKQWFVAGLITLGTVGMMVAVFGLRLCQFKYSVPDVAPGAPPGDCLVIDEKETDTFHIIIGEENIIQAVFQRRIECQLSPYCKCALLLAGSLLTVYVLASVLYLPNVSLTGQLLFGVANLIGFVTDVVKASKNSNLGLAKTAREDFKIEFQHLAVFGNRTAAVAYVAKHAKNSTMLMSKKLLPCEGPVWQKWWQKLANRIDNANDTSINSAEEPMGECESELLEILLKDMTVGLEE